MEVEKILELISQGRTDLIIELIKKPNWQEILRQGQIKTLQWLVYYNDTTALRAVLSAGGNFDSIIAGFLVNGLLLSALFLILRGFLHLQKKQFSQRPQLHLHTFQSSKIGT